MKKSSRGLRILPGILAASLLGLTLTACGVSEEDVAIDKQIAADQARVAKCDEVRAKSKEITDYSSNLVKEARRAQLTWITDEMNTLKESGKISIAEWEVFSQYIKPGITPPKMPGGELELLMKKVVAKGYIRPYLPKEVVELGTKAALSPNSASYEVGFPECFSDIEFAGIKMLADLEPVKGVWGNKVENPSDLIP
jgi:hypothetical protein